MKADENVLKATIHDWIIFKISLHKFHKKALQTMFSAFKKSVFILSTISDFFAKTPL